MNGKIFINYRRGDDPGNTGRLFDRLQEDFAPQQLFLDVDGIAPGLDFVRVLQERVAECDVMLTVIGKGWIDARDAAGTRRLDDPDDFVRIEIASALSQDKRVIPILVGGAEMPRAEQLPEVLRLLARRNAVRLTHERFRSDLQSLVKALQQVLGEGDAAQSERGGARPTWMRSWPMLAASTALVIVLLGGATLLWRQRAPSAPHVAAVTAAIRPSASDTPARAAAPPPAAAETAAPLTPTAPIMPNGSEAGATAAPVHNETKQALVTKSIKRDVSLGYLNLRSGPGQDQKVLARIPAGTTGVVMTGSCMAPQDGHSGYPFCLVEWNGLRGWVSSNGLE
jgi:hypothetical protein